MTPSVDIARPDDWHVHLRDDEMLSAVVEYSARHFRNVIIMPNLRPPVTSVAQARAYRDRILACAPPQYEEFTPWMTLFATPDLDLDDLRAGVAEGVVKAVKFYPAGATTNSDQARGGLDDLNPLLDVLTELGLRLLVHAESTRPDVDVFDREAAFLTDELAPVVARRPDLAVTLEHVSTAAGVDFVVGHQNLAATVTPHHLARDRGDLLADGARPDLYCKPIINSPTDRRALVAAVTCEQDSFVLGTDSAPHPATAKYGPKAAAGVFNAPYGLETVAEVFHQADALECLDGFVSGNGCSIYGVDRPTSSLRLSRRERPAAVPQLLRTERGDDVVFFGTEEAALWSIEPL